MATLTFWGGVGSVTGSKYLLEHNGKKVLVDCGLFQGERQLKERNWQDPPFNRWAFQHVRELIPTVGISRGSGPPWRLPSDDRDIAEVRFRHDDRKLSIADFFAPKSSGKMDVIGLSLVTIGPKASAQTQRLFEGGEYTKYLYLHGLSATGLIGPDEPRYAFISRAMAQTGDWITPRLWVTNLPAKSWKPEEV